MSKEMINKKSMLWAGHREKGEWEQLRETQKEKDPDVGRSEEQEKVSKIGKKHEK